MSDQTRQQLQQAYEFIKAGQREQAGTILVAILKRDRNNADAWWLLANASNDPDKARQALENVLRIRPDDVRAREKLDKLGGTASEPPPSSHFSMPISPTSSSTDPFGATTSNDDPFASFPQPAWSADSTPKADDMPMVSPFGDFDLDNFDPSADIPFPEAPSEKPVAAASGSVISRPGARTVNTTAPGDPFGEVTYGGDPFADVGALRPKRNAPDPLAPPKRSGRNPVIVVLFLSLFACAICAVVAIAAIGPQINAGIQQVQQVLLTVTSDPDFATVMAASGTMVAASSTQSQAGNGQALPNDLNNRGSLSYGQALNNTVDGMKDDSWTFSGTTGDQVMIEADANSDLDPQLALYDTSRKQIAQNDDIDFGTNKNSRITITLPKTGTYTIVVSAFGSGGAYTLHLSQQ